jgi:hypothetical protein
MPIIIILLHPQLPRRVIILLRIIGFVGIIYLISSLLPKNNPLYIVQLILGIILVVVTFITRTQIGNRVAITISKKRNTKN